MKIVAQSLVPTKHTYIHIGYVAANGYNDGRSAVVFALVSFLILVYQIQNKKKLWKIGITLILIGVAGYLSFFVLPRR